MGPWTRVRRFDSSDTNVFKYVFEGPSAVAEAVLYRYPSFEERTVVCCSTQSGCPVGCRFCGAGDSFIRSLSSDEIVAQVQYLFADKSIDTAAVKRLQIMFMSMGEPMLNRYALSEALYKPHRLYPSAALLVSTMGPRVEYDWFRKISIKLPVVGLQFSVHESTDARRKKLIPFERKLTLAEIATEGDLWCKATGRQPFFNYCAQEANTSNEDADRLAQLFDPHIWQATVSVVCEQNESVATAHERQRTLASGFMSKLLERGFSARMFDPAGQDDIGGGCGQLWYVQDWMRQHPEDARPSIGRSYPQVHPPRPR